MEDTVELYVKANAKNGVGLGDCPFSHRIMMMLKLKNIPCDYYPINLTIKPKAFEEFCQNSGVPMKVPILKHGEFVTANSNDIANYLDKKWPDPELRTGNQAANAIGRNVFIKFTAYLKNKVKDQDEKLQHALLEEIRKLDSFLGSDESPGKFLADDELKHPDCDLLPKLWHLEVALKHYKKFQVPEEFAHYHAYIAAAKEDPAFKNTAPSEEAIIEGWRKHVF